MSTTSDLMEIHGLVHDIISPTGYTTENIPVDKLHDLFIESILWLRNISQNPKKGVASWEVTVDYSRPEQQKAYELISMGRLRGIIEGKLSTMPSLKSKYTQTQFNPVFTPLSGRKFRIAVTWNKL